MDGYLSKPIDVDDLYTTVESFASPGRVTMSSAGQPPAAAPSVVFDESGAMRRTGDDRQLLRRIVGLFTTGYAPSVRAIERAIARRDGEALRVAAHTLKGSVANVGGQIAREQAARLEEMGRSNQLDAAAPALDALKGASADLFAAFAAAGLAARARKRAVPRRPPRAKPARRARRRS